MRLTLNETIKIYLLGLIIFSVGSLFGDKQLALYAALFYAIDRLNDLKIREIKDLIGW